MTSLPLRDAAPLIVGLRATLREAIERLEATGVGLVLVVDETGRLRATLSDGDVRRAALRSESLTATAADLGSSRPVTAPVSATRRQLLAVFRDHGVRQIPLVDELGRPVSLAAAVDIAAAVRPETVVIMAGGRGSRLGPLTAETPKPLLDVGGRPILETIVDQLAADGFTTLLFAVNYQADRIRSHFGDGSRFGVQVDYLQEERPLGTAGALRLLADRLVRTFIVLNADLLTSLHLGELVDHHRAAKNGLTLAVSEVEVELRYGVVDIDPDGTVTGMREKPKVPLTANAGIYVLEPVVLALVPDGASDMPEIVAAAITRGIKVGSFRMHDLWLDIGELADLQRAQTILERIMAGG